MTADLEQVVAQVIGDHLKALTERVDRRIVEAVDRAVAQKPLPPFVPPMPWTQARYGAGTVVRHRNGIFSALRDTEGEPGADPGGAWLPLVVGIADVGVAITGRTFAVTILCSDGAQASVAEELPIPVYQGSWNSELNYAANDMVTSRGSIWIALQETGSRKPGTDEAAEYWRLAVKSGERAHLPKFTINADGLVTCAFGDEVREVGNIKQLVVDALREALPPEALP